MLLLSKALRLRLPLTKKQRYAIFLINNKSILFFIKKITPLQVATSFPLRVFPCHQLATALLHGVERSAQAATGLLHGVERSAQVCDGFTTRCSKERATCGEIFHEIRHKVTHYSRKFIRNDYFCNKVLIIRKDKSEFG